MCNSPFFSRALLTALIAVAGTQASHALNVYGIADETIGGNFTQSLVNWSSSNPADLISSKPISGLKENDKLVAMDFDFGYAPGNQRLLAIGYGNGGFLNPYSIDVASGVATILPSAYWLPQSFYIVSSESFGMMVTGERIEIVGDGGREYASNRIYNDTYGGGFHAFVEGDVNFGKTPNVVHTFSDWSGWGPRSVYGFDSGVDAFVTFVGGDMSTWMTLNEDFDAAGGMDINPYTGSAFAALLPAGQSVSKFYSIDPVARAIVEIGPIGGKLISAMTIEPSLGNLPEPSTAALAAISLVALARFRSRQRT